MNKNILKTVNEANDFFKEVYDTAYAFVCELISECSEEEWRGFSFKAWIETDVNGDETVYVSYNRWYGGQKIDLLDLDPYKAYELIDLIGSWQMR